VVLPVGGTKPVAVDFRLLAATHRPLAEMVERGEFREDLFSRIAGTTLTLPPLRERRADLGLLVMTLLGRLLEPPTQDIELAAKAARSLFFYGWPRNVRELQSCLEAALAIRTGKRIELAQLPEGPRAALETAMAQPALSAADAARRAELSALLKEHGGNVSAAARAMGKARVQIQRWIKRYGLKAK
jgi:transcriptional regulator of acetoin/glycerol metabolism